MNDCFWFPIWHSPTFDGPSNFKERLGKSAENWGARPGSRFPDLIHGFNDYTDWRSSNKGSVESTPPPSLNYSTDWRSRRNQALLRTSSRWLPKIFRDQIPRRCSTTGVWTKSVCEELHRQQQPCYQRETYTIYGIMEWNWGRCFRTKGRWLSMTYDEISRFDKHPINMYETLILTYSKMINLSLSCESLAESLHFRLTEAPAGSDLQAQTVLVEGAGALYVDRDGLNCAWSLIYIYMYIYRERNIYISLSL